MTLDDVATLAQIVSALVTSAAVMVGGVWAYFRFFKDRTYRPRLDIDIAGTWLDVAGARLLLVRVTVKNVGAARVELIQRGSGLEVAGAQGIGTPLTSVRFERLAVLSVLTDHEWIEAGETVWDEVMVNLDPPPDAIRLTSRLTWTFNLTRHETVVVTRRLLTPPTEGVLGSSSEKEPTHEQTSPAPGQQPDRSRSAAATTTTARAAASNARRLGAGQRAATSAGSHGEGPAALSL